MKRLLLFCGLLFASLARGAPLVAGDYELELQHDERDRSYIVHVPPQVNKGEALPVVVNFHGGGGHAKAQQAYSRMDVTADREGFIVVYPDGTGGFASRLLTWNAGKCCGYAQKKNVDDVGFMRALLNDLAQRVGVDRRRIYATGMSNGAMMAYRLAAEAGDIIAAIAPVAGAMQLESFAPPRSLPVLHIHSVDDPRALYAGGVGPRFPLTNHRVDHEPVERSLRNWAILNKCGEDAELIKTRLGGRGTAMEKHTAELFVFPHCAAGNEVALWRLHGAGHVWPGGKQGYLEGVLGESTEIINVNDEMWAFFKRFALSE